MQVDLLCVALAALLAGPPQQSELKAWIEQLESVGTLQIAGETIQQSPVLAAVYRQSNFARLWPDPGSTSQLLQILRAVQSDGLDPANYHAAAIEKLAATLGTAARAQLDLLQTSALIRIAYDLRRGRVDAARIAPWREYSGPLRTEDPARDILDLLHPGPSAGARGASLSDRVLTLRPTHFVYRGLMDAAARFRALKQAGGWPVIPGALPIRPDSTDPRVPQLRQRLVLEGDLARDSAAEGLVYDTAMQSAVRGFQHRHGLNQDAVVGAATLTELNIPVTTRIDQIRINLERARWVTHDLPNTFIAVNVAGAMVYYVNDGEVAFETRAIVGKEYTSTPVFRANLQHIELNPTWTVPASIVGEILRAVARNPAYLREQNIRILTRAGTRVDPGGIDFTKYSARSFPYIFRQEAGPLNPLGRIKLVFPNRYNVYLHDTPARTLFESERRLFSHGCIRVDQPVRLAALVLNDPKWSEARLQDAIETGDTKVINVDRPVPVLILYWTASADLHGDLHFYRDVYLRDAKLLQALDAK